MTNVPTINNQPTFYWHLELSSKCALACPRCPRTEKPGQYKVTELSIDLIRNIFTSDILEDTTTIMLCGGQGDPLYCKDMLEIVEYFKDHNPDIELVIVTNGSYRRKDWWEKLAHILNNQDTVVFSVDGWDNESNNKYRVNSNFDSILTGITTLANKNPEITLRWSTIVFSFNEHHLEKIQEVATQAGATEFQVVQSSLFGSKLDHYIDKQLGYDPLEPGDRDLTVSAYAHSDRGLTIPLRSKPKSKIKKKQFRQNVAELLDRHIDRFNNTNLLPACLLNERGLYIDAEGILYPCSWISHPFGTRRDDRKVVKWQDSLFVKHKDKFNLHNYSVRDILTSEYWNKLHRSFSDTEKMFVECASKCSKQATMARTKNIVNKIPAKTDTSVLDNLKEYRQQGDQNAQ